MSIHTLLTNALPFINGTVKSVNYGGCGHFAYLLSDALAAKRIDSAIVLVDQGYYPEDIACMTKCHGGDINAAYKAQLDSDDYHNPCFGHIVVRVDGALYDSTGVAKGRVVISEPIDSAIMSRMVHEGDCWNPVFLNSNDCNVDEASVKFTKFFNGMLGGVAHA